MIRRPSPRRFASLLATLGLVFAVTAPPAALAARADVTVTVDPYPSNVTPPDPPTSPSAPPLEGFVTAGELVAFDVTVTNNSNSTVTGLMLGGAITGTPVTGTYERTHVIAGLATCSSATDPRTSTFSCALGNLAANSAPVRLRVVVQTPDVETTLTMVVTGSASGATGSDSPGQSRGDTFSDATEVAVVALFRDNVLLQRGVGAFIDAGDAGTRLPFSSDDANFGTDNPLHTTVTTPAFPAADVPFGTSIWFTEFAEQSPLCPDGNPCFGQTLELHLFDGQALPEPARVEVKYDELKVTLKALNKWQLWHFDDGGGNPVELFGNACTFGTNGLPTNAPCGESRSFDTTDRDDGIGIVWLDRNGYIRGG